MRFLRAFIAAVLLSALGYLAMVALGLAYPPLRLFGLLTQFLGVPWLFQIIHSIFGLGQGGKIFAFTGVTLLWLGGLTLMGGLARPLLAGLIAALLTIGLAPWGLALAYGAAFGLLLWALSPLSLRGPRASAPGDPQRRAVTLALTGGGVALAAGGLTGLFRQTGGAAATPAVTAGGPLPFGVTPVKDFYYVSKNLEAFDPQVNGDRWSLKVGGLVKNPRSFSLADLKSFEPVRSERTLACISNPVGGPLISNGIWEGFRLADLLRQVGVQGGARYLLWEAADGYTESLPLGEALDPEILLVHSLNGAALNHKHGFPLRVLIPGRYGMKQPRWITGIRLSAEDEPGYWVQRGWSKTARIELTSRIDVPAETTASALAGQPGFIRGVAFYGEKPITKVEVTTDGGQTWQRARLIQPRTKFAWTLWELPWNPEAGPHQLAARAYSGSLVQKVADKDALPEGATGYHHFIVNAS